MCFCHSAADDWSTRSCHSSAQCSIWSGDDRSRSGSRRCYSTTIVVPGCHAYWRRLTTVFAYVICSCIWACFHTLIGQISLLIPKALLAYFRKIILNIPVCYYEAINKSTHYFLFSFTPPSPLSLPFPLLSLLPTSLSRSLSPNLSLCSRCLRSQLESIMIGLFWQRWWQRLVSEASVVSPLLPAYHRQAWSTCRVRSVPPRPSFFRTFWVIIFLAIYRLLKFFKKCACLVDLFGYIRLRHIAQESPA